MKLLSDEELNIIRGKLMAGHATLDEIKDFLFYVSNLESLLDDADDFDVFGDEGWKHSIEGIS